MEFISWIDRNILDIKKDDLFKRYFNNIPLENGIDVLMLFNPSFGIDIILTMEQIVKALHFYGSRENDVERFSGTLPFNLNFSLPRELIRNKFGEPHQFGGGDFSFLYGITPNWDKYFFENFSLHFQFTQNNEAIDLITIDSLRYTDL